MMGHRPKRCNALGLAIFSRQADRAALVLSSLSLPKPHDAFGTRVDHWVLLERNSAPFRGKELNF
jgi:hypothetical protein